MFELTRLYSTLTNTLRWITSIIVRICSDGVAPPLANSGRELDYDPTAMVRVTCPGNTRGVRVYVGSRGEELWVELLNNGVYKETGILGITDLFEIEKWVGNEATLNKWYRDSGTKEIERLTIVVNLKDWHLQGSGSQDTAREFAGFCAPREFVARTTVRLMLKSTRAARSEKFM